MEALICGCAGFWLPCGSFLRFNGGEGGYSGSGCGGGCGGGD
jgi:hypothetical protein